MGTRSLLAVENEPKQYHVQFMQFDGYPTCKGSEYFAAVVKGLGEGQDYFCTNKLPNERFFQRCVHFLNDYQYQTYHSIGRNFRCTDKEFVTQRMWQEWMYLWAGNGDFHAIKDYGEGRVERVIVPWEFTLHYATHFWPGTKGEEHVKAWKGIWESVKEYLGWDSEYTKEPRPEPPIAVLTYGQVMAFPDQGQEHGMRDYAILSTSKDRIFSQFASQKHHTEKRVELVINPGE